MLDTVADFLLSSWNSAGRAKLTVTEIPAAHLHIPEVRCEEVRDTVSSLRLDAVCSTGFRMGEREGGRFDLLRPCPGELAALYEGGQAAYRGGHGLRPGDLENFSWRRVGGVTKKGRTAIVVKRYI